MQKKIILSFIYSFIFSQEKDSLMMVIDSLKINQQLLMNQQKMLENQQKILNEVEYIDPLDGKKIGFEFNPVSFLFASADNQITFSGGISFFTISKTAEIAFPIYSRSGDDGFSLNQIDCHYRIFLGKHRNGFYISSGIRHISIEGKEDNSYFDLFGIGPTSDNILKISKSGLTFGIGYRIFGKNGWYWGASIFGGRYLDKSDVKIKSAPAAHSEGIIDMEFFKIGRLF